MTRSKRLNWKNEKITFLLAILSFIHISYAGDLEPFTSDGCSEFPDGIGKHKDLWLSCCIEHDKAYWKGGTYQQRLEADEKLERCVSAVGEPLIADIMLAGVRVGGSPYLPTKFRWGYGWPYGRGYKALSEEELKEAERLLSKSRQK